MLSLPIVRRVKRRGHSLRVPSRGNDDNKTYNKTSADVLMREGRDGGARELVTTYHPIKNGQGR